eukprot:360412-Chlamydomonas_euryale.AAC.2
MCTSTRVGLPCGMCPKYFKGSSASPTMGAPWLGAAERGSAAPGPGRAHACNPPIAIPAQPSERRSAGCRHAPRCAPSRTQRRPAPTNAAGSRGHQPAPSAAEPPGAYRHRARLSAAERRGHTARRGAPIVGLHSPAARYPARHAAAPEAGSPARHAASRRQGAAPRSCRAPCDCHLPAGRLRRFGCARLRLGACEDL